MSELSLQELESTAASYEELLVPALLQPWTRLVLDAARVKPGERVLDVACGTGVLARAAAARVGPSGSVTGLDINPGMLSVAARLAPEVTWFQGPAEALPFGAESFDAVLSQFGLMFFTDRRAALQEMRRVLVPGGRLAVLVFAALEAIPAYAAYVELLERLGHQGAAEALRYPFSLGDREELSALVADAGITAARVTTHEETVRFASVEAMVAADVEGWFPLAHIALDEGQFTALVAEGKRALEPFATPEGAVSFRVSAHLVTAEA